MNKKDSEKMKKSNKQLDGEKGVSGASNVHMINMYNMPEMESGPGDATLEEKIQLKERSLANNESNKK